MAPKFKRAKKTRELADRYTVVLAQRSTYTGNYKALQPHSHDEAFDKHSMGGKNLVLGSFGKNGTSNFIARAGWAWPSESR